MLNPFNMFRVSRTAALPFLPELVLAALDGLCRLPLDNDDEDRERTTPPTYTPLVPPPPPMVLRPIDDFGRTRPPLALCFLFVRPSSFLGTPS